MSRLKQACLALCLALLSAVAQAQTPGPFVANTPLPAAALNSAFATKGDNLQTASGTITPRTLANRAADVLNAKDFGAALNGVGDDTAALALARLAAGNNQTIYIPYGPMVKTANPTGGPASGVRWLLDGTVFAGTSDPVLQFTPGDLVETHFSGTKFFGREQNPVDPQPGVRIDYNLTTAGGTPGNVSSALVINGTSGAGSLDSLWALLINLNVNSNTTAGWPQPVGATININKNATAQSWGMSLNVADTQNLASSLGGGFNGIEMGMQVNGADDAAGSGGGSRRFLDLIVSNYNAGGVGGRIGNGILIRNASITAGIDNAFHAGVSAGGGNNITNGFVSEAANSFVVQGVNRFVGLTTALATFTGPAIRLAAGQKISLEASDTVQLYYDSPSQKVFFSVGGVNKWSSDISGNVRAAGTFTPSVTP
jgi:hypothetical protein